MSGDTDLDILFDYKYRSALEEILKRLDFVGFSPVLQKQYNDIEDFIGLDDETGKIIHLHAHFRLTIGEPYLKGYQLNRERQVLDKRVFDNRFNVYRANPAHELILLFCRHALKLRNRDKLKVLLNKGLRIPSPVVREYQWLKSQCPAAEIKTAAALLLPNTQAVEIFQGAFSKKQLVRLSRLLSTELKEQRTYRPLNALLLRWKREVVLKIKRKIVLRSQYPIIVKRVHPVKGLVVGVVGADGSGKSTVISHLNSTFSKKLDVYPIYFGNGGYASLSTKLLRLFGKKKPRNKRGKASSSGSGPEKPQGFIKTLFKCLDAIEIASVKRKNLRRMCIAREKGMMVICDRYPQSQVLGYNDGPKLNGFLDSSNLLFRRMAEKERRIFSRFDTVSPDIVFKLVADARLIESRKPGQTPLPVLEKKIAAIVDLRFPSGTKVITIDASRPIDNVLQTIKSKIWEYYHQ